MELAETLSYMQHLSNKSKMLGLTVVELIIAITVLGVLIGVVIGPLGDFYTDSTGTLSKTTQDTDTRSVLRTIESDLSSSSGFLATLTPASTPLGSDDNLSPWYYCGVGNSTCTQTTNYRVLIGTAYATDKPVTDGTRLPVFLQNGGSCDRSISNAVKNAYIYYAAPDPSKANTYNLYRRTIVNTAGGSYCAGTSPWQKQSCNPAKIAANPGPCQGADALILSNIASFTVDYYSSPGDTAPYADTYNSAIPAATREATLTASQSIKVTVGTTQNINGSTSKITSSIRISLPS